MGTTMSNLAPSIGPSRRFRTPLDSFEGVVTQKIEGLHERTGSSPVYAPSMALRPFTTADAAAMSRPSTRSAAAIVAASTPCPAVPVAGFTSLTSRFLAEGCPRLPLPERRRLSLERTSCSYSALRCPFPWPHCCPNARSCMAAGRSSSTATRRPSIPLPCSGSRIWPNSPKPCLPSFKLFPNARSHPNPVKL